MKKRPKATRRTSDGLRILDRITGRDRQRRDEIAEAKMNLRVAQLIHDARKAAGLTQQQVAHFVGTTQSVIARLEDADYEGHSLTMLNRIATALHQTLEVKFVPHHTRERRAAAS
jgi:ribosome-binding protein aMBF1 (putative translation factor)